MFLDTERTRVNLKAQDSHIRTESSQEASDWKGKELRYQLAGDFSSVVCKGGSNLHPRWKRMESEGRKIDSCLQ